MKIWHQLKARVAVACTVLLSVVLRRALSVVGKTNRNAKLERCCVSRFGGSRLADSRADKCVDDAKLRLAPLPFVNSDTNIKLDALKIRNLSIYGLI